MEEAQREAETSLSKFSYALDQLENALRPALKAIDELRASGNEDDLDAMSRARMHISLCYSVNSLFCMYLRTQGVDPATHPVSEEIGRVQDAFMRMRKVETGRSADHQPAPDRDRRRHIVNAKKSAEKLATLVFPEEVDLLNAIRGKKRKREKSQEKKEKKKKKGGRDPRTHEANKLDKDDGERDDRRLHTERGNENLVKEKNERGKNSSKNQRVSPQRTTTDSRSSDEEQESEAQPEESSKQKRAGPGSADVHGSDTKKKKIQKSKAIESTAKKSKGKKDRKGKKESSRTESKSSEEKRKRKKRKEAEKHANLAE